MLMLPRCRLPPKEKAIAEAAIVEVEREGYARQEMNQNCSEMLHSDAAPSF